MRIIFQGSMSPNQLGKAVEEIVLNTLEKAEAEGKPLCIHNPVVEMSLNIVGEEMPMLLFDTEKESMITIHTGYENGEFTEYKEVDREELLNKFNELVEKNNEE